MDLGRHLVRHRETLDHKRYELLACRVGHVSTCKRPNATRQVLGRPLVAHNSYQAERPPDKQHQEQQRPCLASYWHAGGNHRSHQGLSTKRKSEVAQDVGELSSLQLKPEEKHRGLLT